MMKFQLQNMLELCAAEAKVASRNELLIGLLLLIGENIFVKLQKTAVVKGTLVALKKERNMFLCFLNTNKAG